MPPHQVFGLTWAEIASIFGLLGLVYGGIRSLIKTFRNSISGPLMIELARVRHSIDDLTDKSGREHQQFDKRLDKHDIKLGQHDVEIGTLYSTVGLNRKKGNHEED